MVEWLKFFFGSFFVNKYAMQGAERKVGNAILAFVLGWIAIFAGITIGYSGSFKTHYYNCPQAVSSVSAIFENGVSIKTENFRAVSGTDDKYDNALTINTFSNTDDAEKYSKNGFGIILDTRPRETTFDDFTVSITDKAGDKSLTYDEYRELSVGAKANYEVTIDYTGIALNITEDLLQKYVSYLDKVSDVSDTAYNPEIAKLYSELEKDDSYTNNIYELYFKSYYPELVGKDSYSAAPSIRTWYVKNIFENKQSEQYIAILDDTVIGNFTTKGGLPVSFNGYYMKTNGNVYQTADQGNEFIITAFKGSSVLNLNIYLINLLKITPIIVLIPVMIALILFIIDRFVKSGLFGKFGGTLKIVSSFVFMSSLITFLITILLSFFVSRGTVFSLVLLVFGLCIFIRTVILAVMRFISETRYRIPQNDDNNIN